MILAAILVFVMVASVLPQDVDHQKLVMDSIQQLRNDYEKQQEYNLRHITRLEEQLQEQRLKQQEDIVQLEKQLQKQRVMSLKQQEDIVQLEKHLNRRFTNELKSLNTSVNGLEVAVSAYRVIDFVGGGTLIFDKVDLNIGDGYDPGVGIFRAPVSGVYFVQVSLMNTSSSGTCYGLIQLNGNTIRGMIVDKAQTWQSASMHYLLRMNALDSLKVEIPKGRTCHSNNDRYSGISVFLVGK